MFINATGFYVPEERVDNQHFLELNGLTSEWIEQRTGIRSRSKAKAEENINTMSMEAVRNALPKLPYDINGCRFDCFRLLFSVRYGSDCGSSCPA